MNSPSTFETKVPQFSKRRDSGGSILKMHKNARGVEILRHRNGLLCKSCQTIL